MSATAARTTAKASTAAKAKVLPPARAFAKQQRVTGQTLARLGGKHSPVEGQRFSLPKEFRRSNAVNYSPTVSSFASPAQNPVRGNSLISGAGLLEALGNLPQAGSARQDVAGLAIEDGRWQYGWMWAQAETIYAGSSEIQRNIIAERVLGLPRGR